MGCRSLLLFEGVSTAGVGVGEKHALQSVVTEFANAVKVPQARYQVWRKGGLLNNSKPGGWSAK
jgi:hypothetical protein